ncbi:FUSC family protein [Leucobacter sp. 1207-22]|uniref:FUSC family protein n=1 Tax=Leucobacter sp. 1207-22 TaxID=2604456 RepID=UPI0040641FFB
MSRKANLRQVLSEAFRSLWALPAGPGPRQWIALRAAASMGVPLAIGTLLGGPGIGLQVGTGAFTALFFADLPAAERARSLPFVGALLFGCAALGGWLAQWPLASAIGLVLAAVLSSAISYGLRFGPPGPVFFVLMYGLAGTIAGPQSPVPLGEFLLALAVGIVFAYVIALLPLLRRVERDRPTRPFREIIPRFWLGRGEQELLLRVAIVAIVGTVVSELWIEPSRAYWTVSSGVAVIGLSTVRRHSVGRGLHRSLGTILGAALFMLIAPLGANPWMFVLIIAIFQFAIEIVVVRNYAFALVFITPLVLFISSAASAASGAGMGATAEVRVIDTLVGAALAILTAFVHPPRVTTSTGTRRVVS